MGGDRQRIAYALGDQQLLVDRNHVDGHTRPRRRDAARDADRVVVGGGVELYTEPLELTANPRSHDGRVLADAAADRDRVEAAENRGIRADVLEYAVMERRERERRAFVAVRLELEQLAHVAARAREALETRFPM